MSWIVCFSNACNIRDECVREELSSKGSFRVVLCTEGLEFRLQSNSCLASSRAGYGNDDKRCGGPVEKAFSVSSGKTT